MNPRRAAPAFLCLIIGCLLPPGASRSPAAPPDIGRIGHAVQVGAFANVRNAEALAARLQEKGIEAFYFRNEKDLYVVRFGDFPSQQEAQEQAGKFAAEGLIGAYFISPPRSIPAKDGGPSREGSPATAKMEEDMGHLTARTAERFLGIPYRWGGNNVAEGLDCSGFVRAVYHLVGVTIPRTAGEQFKTGHRVGRKDLRDGDLVFFGEGGRITHVGIYAGGGRFVHAPRRGMDIMVSPLDAPGLSRTYVGARRYF